MVGHPTKGPMVKRQDTRYGTLQNLEIDVGYGTLSFKMGMCRETCFSQVFQRRHLLLVHSDH